TSASPGVLPHNSRHVDPEPLARARFYAHVKIRNFMVLTSAVDYATTLVANMRTESSNPLQHFVARFTQHVTRCIPKQLFSPFIPKLDAALFREDEGRVGRVLEECK